MLYKIFKILVILSRFFTKITPLFFFGRDTSRPYIW